MCVCVTLTEMLLHDTGMLSKMISLVIFLDICVAYQIHAQMLSTKTGFMSFVAEKTNEENIYDQSLDRQLLTRSRNSATTTVLPNVLRATSSLTKITNSLISAISLASQKDENNFLKISSSNILEI